MFFTQVVIPVVIIAAVCFWAGGVWRSLRREEELSRPTITEIRKRYEGRRKQYDYPDKRS